MFFLCTNICDCCCAPLVVLLRTSCSAVHSHTTVLVHSRAAEAERSGEEEGKRGRFRVGSGIVKMDPREFEKKTHDELDDILNR